MVLQGRDGKCKLGVRTLIELDQLAFQPRTSLAHRFKIALVFDTCEKEIFASYTKMPAAPRFTHKTIPLHQAFLVILFSFLFPSLSLSFSKNFLCSSALIPLILLSLISFFFFSLSFLLSSACSSSLAFLIFFCSSSRTVRILRVTSGRKWAWDAN